MDEKIESIGRKLNFKKISIVIIESDLAFV